MAVFVRKKQGSAYYKSTTVKIEVQHLRRFPVHGA